MVEFIKTLKEENIDMSASVLALISEVVFNPKIEKDVFKNCKIFMELNSIIVQYPDGDRGVWNLIDFLNHFTHRRVLNRKITKHYKVNNHTLKVIHPSDLGQLNNDQDLTKENITELSKLPILLIMFKTGIKYRFYGIIYKDYVFMIKRMGNKLTPYIKYKYGFKCKTGLSRIYTHNKDINPDLLPDMEIFIYLYKYKDRSMITLYPKTYDGYEELHGLG